MLASSPAKSFKMTLQGPLQLFSIIDSYLEDTIPCCDSFKKEPPVSINASSKNKTNLHFLYCLTGSRSSMKKNLHRQENKERLLFKCVKN